MIPWQVFAQGEYVGPARLAHVPQYHLRVDDIIRMIYGLTGEPSSKPYSLAVGDIVQIESNGDPKIARSVTIQPDGMVTLRDLGQVRAAGLNLEDLRKDLDSRVLAIHARAGDQRDPGKTQQPRGRTPFGRRPALWPRRPRRIRAHNSGRHGSIAVDRFDSRARLDP